MDDLGIFPRIFGKTYITHLQKWNPKDIKLLYFHKPSMFIRHGISCQALDQIVFGNIRRRTKLGAGWETDAFAAQ